MYLDGKRPGMGRRIGPKTWDRIVEFLEILGLSVNARKLDGLLCWNLGIKFFVGMYEIGNSYGNWNRCRMSGLPVDSPLPLFWGLNCGVL